jgi:2-polyprenyl-3-methyl-5-hydroxy-6-metoxy-1,4-benzoquinol methylase
MSEAETAMSPEMENLKTKLKATWTAGDFGQIADAYQAEAAEFIERLNLQPGEKVLDVACGTGNTAIPAARQGAIVTGVDIAANLLEQARAKAAAEGLICQFDEGDAEALVYRDGTFDTVISMFGAMFAPRPERVAAELIRVSRPGGRIVMANWTALGFVGQMFKRTALHVTPPNMPSPILWGDEATVTDRLKDGIGELSLERRLMTFRFPFSPAEVVEHFRKFYGPTQKAFASIADDEEKQTSLRSDLENLWQEHNLATDGTTRIQSEYLEVIARRT